MKTVFATLSAAAFLALATPVHAQAAAQVPATSSAEALYAEGEVRRVDKSGGKITLRHGEIKALDMPPMTMVFGVKEAAMLDQVKVGDKVRFKAANQEGKFTLTEIVRAP